jgi:rhodanese-related sulfurtransferase
MTGAVDRIDVATLARAMNANEPSELADAVLLDVREPWEFDTARIERSVNIPMSTLVARIDEVRALQQTATTPIVVICHHGMRSMQCARYLAGQGIGSLINLTGGIDAWSTQIDPTVPAY